MTHGQGSQAGDPWPGGLVAWPGLAWPEIPGLVAWPGLVAVIPPAGDRLAGDPPVVVAVVFVRLYNDQG